jgi:hypothetical protein
MGIHITVDGDRYLVSVSPPEGPYWRSREALTATGVLATLSQLGCHSTDITDALYEADPTWAAKHDREVSPRRRAGEDPIPKRQA